MTLGGHSPCSLRRSIIFPSAMPLGAHWRVLFTESPGPPWRSIWWPTYTTGTSPPLSAELSKEFYADEGVMREAVRACRPFNLIHYESSYKFDLFPVPADPYYQGELDRRTVTEFSFGEGSSLRFPVVTPEDTVLTKLVWRQTGGEVSERQWSDVLGIIKVRGQELDQEYLRRWAAHLGVTQLLQRVWERGQSSKP